MLAEYGEFDFGSIKVKVFHGDITEQKKDAIVASSNLDLDLTKGEKENSFNPLTFYSVSFAKMNIAF